MPLETIFHEHFVNVNFVFLGNEARRFHENHSVLCTCLLFAMHSDCPCSVFVRSLPWKCREPDVNLHDFPTRGAVAESFARKRERPETPQELRQKLRQTLLKNLLEPPAPRVKVSVVLERSDVTSTAVMKSREEVPEEPLLKKFRRVQNWEGHWVQCDECKNWLKATKLEHDSYVSKAFHCKYVNVRCKPA